MTRPIRNQEELWEALNYMALKLMEEGKGDDEEETDRE